MTNIPLEELRNPFIGKPDINPDIEKIIIYDLSAILISGARNKKFQDFNTGKIPTGGLYKVFMFLLRDFKALDGKTAIVLCKDSKKNIRKEAFPYYKSSRKKKIDSTTAKLTSKQFELVNEAVDGIGTLNIEVPGLEADDLIYSIVRQNPTKKILIRADDEDLDSVFWMHPDVRFESPTGKAPDRENGKNTEYNKNAMARKIVYGDVSDDIKPIDATPQIKQQLAYYLDSKSCLIPIYERQVTFEDCLKITDEENAKILMENIYLVQPKYIDEPIKIKPTVVNNDRLRDVFDLFRFKKFSQSYFGADINPYRKDIIYRYSNIQYTLDPEILEYFARVNNEAEVKPPSKLDRIEFKEEGKLILEDSKVSKDKLEELDKIFNSDEECDEAPSTYMTLCKDIESLLNDEEYKAKCKQRILERYFKDDITQSSGQGISSDNDDDNDVNIDNSTESDISNKHINDKYNNVLNNVYNETYNNTYNTERHKLLSWKD